jgi:antiviral defense system Shedu protein SduA
MEEALFPDLFVPWRQLTRYEIAAFENALDGASNESDMQRFLEDHPHILIQQFTVDRGAWVIPKKRLGSEYVPDFLIAQEASGGLVWYAVEIERPQATLFNKNGDASALLNHALGQINDWREWLSQNRDYADKPPGREGLGLINISPDLDGLVVMGRGSDLDARTTRRRRRLAYTHRVVIETYDWLLSQARERLQIRQADLARAANEITRWREMSTLSDGLVPGPVRSTYLSNIDPVEYSKTNRYPFSDLTEEIPPEFKDFITRVRRILEETNSSLRSIYYDKAHDYVILTPSGYITSAQSDKIAQAGKNLPVKYLLTALVYDV